MREVAIVGSGELGGMLAHAVARRDVARSVRLIDDAGRVAEGKALDIAQSAPIEGFATEVVGSTDVSTAAGAQIVVIADRARDGEWCGDEGLLLLKRVTDLASGALVVCAGAAQRELVERGARELHIPRCQILGSAPEALAAGARALVALELDSSPRDVALSVLGVPPSQIVISWEDATVGGFAVTRLLTEPVRRRLGERVRALWPPGPYALASAAAKSIEALVGTSRTRVIAFVAPDDSSGRRTRTAAVPVRLGPTGIVDIVMPELSVAERVALDNAMLL